MVTVRPLAPGDFESWHDLWQQFLSVTGAEPDHEITSSTWRRLVDPAEAPFGLGAANADDQLIGFAHYLFHRSTWIAGPCCYLEDLFVDPAFRRSGAARALVQAVKAAAQSEGCEEIYLVTTRDNTAAKALYDQVLERTPFIEYRMTLDGAERNATPNQRSAT